MTYLQLIGVVYKASPACLIVSSYMRNSHDQGSVVHCFVFTLMMSVVSAAYYTGWPQKATASCTNSSTCVTYTREGTCGLHACIHVSCVCTQCHVHMLPTHTCAHTHGRIVCMYVHIPRHIILFDEKKSFYVRVGTCTHILAFLTLSLPFIFTDNRTEMGLYRFKRVYFALGWGTAILKTTSTYICTSI